MLLTFETIEIEMRVLNEINEKQMLLSTALNIVYNNAAPAISIQIETLKNEEE